MRGARCAVYARFSCSKQREESIEDQLRVCRAYAAREGMEVARTYADEAISGRTDDRPAFRRMLADAERGLFSVLLVYKLDRFARNRFDSATNRARLRKAGVSVVSATEHIGEGPDGILLESLLEGMAEYYSAQLSENVRRGIEGKALACKCNGRVLYGYRIGPDQRYEIDHDEARAVRLLFERVAAGATIREAIDAVRALGPLGRKRSWSASTASATLRREQYAGVYQFNGHRVEGGMPAIVDRETFDRVQERLSGRRHAPRAGDSVYVLSGKMEDSEGRPFVGSSGTSATGTRHHYYRVTETGRALPRDETEARIAGAVAVELARPGVAERIADIVAEAQARSRSADAEAAEAARAELARNDRAQDRVVDAIAERGLDDRLSAKLDRLEAEHAELEARLAEIEDRVPVVSRDMVLFWIAAMASEPDPATLLAAFVSRVIVADDGALLVAFTLDEIDAESSERAGSPARSHELRMVDRAAVRANRIVPFPGGFAIVVAA